MGSCWSFLLREEVYREGGLSSLRASVHSSIIVSLAMIGCTLDQLGTHGNAKDAKA